MANASPRPSLRWYHALYAAALLLSGYAAREGAGILTALIVLAFWGTMLWQPHLCVTECLIIAGIVLVLLALLLPAVQQSGRSSRRLECRNKLHTIGLALHNYHDDYGCFPPAVVRSADGTPMHSWRVLLLPYVDQIGLHRRYRFDEPWDGPNNRQLFDERPMVYDCWSHEPDDADLAAQRTAYVAIVGDKAAWPVEGSRTLDDLSETAGETLLVSEWSGEPILWSEPGDLPYEEARTMFVSDELPDEWQGHPSQDYFYDYDGSWNILLASGRVRSVGRAVEPAMWEALLDRGQKLSDQQESRFSFGPLVGRHPRWRHWIGLASFVLLSLLPLPWFWRRLTPLSSS